MMGASLMVAHLTPRGILAGEERPDPSAVRLARARRDPRFRANVTKAAARLRALRAEKHHRLAARFAEAIELSEMTGAALPDVMEEMGLLREIYG